MGQADDFNILRRLFHNNDNELMDHIIQNILFFEKNIVEQQNSAILQQIEQNDYCFIRHEVKIINPIKNNQKYSDKDRNHATNTSVIVKYIIAKIWSENNNPLSYYLILVFFR
ncbi:hypothetical protein Barb7_01588 [Bacteroidales bacterium Barb7]|nr:hypothetical protein Barb7_01588 [Bacteroidales bacterium Barb7]